MRQINSKNCALFLLNSFSSVTATSFPSFSTPERIVKKAIKTKNISKPKKEYATKKD